MPLVVRIKNKAEERREMHKKTTWRTEIEIMYEVSSIKKGINKIQHRKVHLSEAKY